MPRNVSPACTHVDICKLTAQWVKQNVKCASCRWGEGERHETETLSDDYETALSLEM